MAASVVKLGGFFSQNLIGLICTVFKLTWLRGAEGELERGQAGGPAGEGQRVVVVEHRRHHY